jgi:hypothetical protein
VFSDLISHLYQGATYDIAYPYTWIEASIMHQFSALDSANLKQAILRTYIKI